MYIYISLDLLEQFAKSHDAAYVAEVTNFCSVKIQPMFSFALPQHNNNYSPLQELTL
jgi:hypothetical protein